MGRKRQLKKEQSRQVATVRELEECFRRGDDEGFLDLFRRSFPTPEAMDGHDKIRELHDAVMTRVLKRALASSNLQDLARWVRRGGHPQHGPLARLALAVLEASAGRYQQASAHLTGLAADDPLLPCGLVAGLSAFLADDVKTADGSELPAELRDGLTLRKSTDSSTLESPAGRAIAAFGQAMAALRHRDFRPGRKLLANLRHALDELQSHFPADKELGKRFTAIVKHLSLLERLIALEQTLKRSSVKMSHAATSMIDKLRPIAGALTAALQDDADRPLDAPLQEALRRRWRTLVGELIARDAVSLANLYVAWPELCDTELELLAQNHADPRASLQLWARTQRLLATDDQHELARLLAGQAKDEPAAHRLVILWELELEAYLRSEPPDPEEVPCHDDLLRSLARMTRQITERLPEEHVLSVARRLRKHFFAICRIGHISADTWHIAEQLLAHFPENFILLVAALVGASRDGKPSLVERCKTRLGGLGAVESFDRRTLLALLEDLVYLSAVDVVAALEAVRPCLADTAFQALLSHLVDFLRQETQDVLGEVTLFHLAEQHEDAEGLSSVYLAELKTYISYLGQRPDLTAQEICLRCLQVGGRNAVQLLTGFFASSNELEAALVTFELLFFTQLKVPFPLPITEAAILAANTSLKRLDRRFKRWLPLMPALILQGEWRYLKKTLKLIEELSQDASLNEADRNEILAAIDELKIMYRQRFPGARFFSRRSKKIDDPTPDASAQEPRKRRSRKRRGLDDPQLSFDF